MAANSFYESLMIYTALQNSTVLTTLQMSENLPLGFDQRTLFAGRNLGSSGLQAPSPSRRQDIQTPNWPNGIVLRQATVRSGLRNVRRRATCQRVTIETIDKALANAGSHV